MTTGASWFCITELSEGRGKTDGISSRHLEIQCEMVSVMYCDLVPRAVMSQRRKPIGDLQVPFRCLPALCCGAARLDRIGTEVVSNKWQSVKLGENLFIGPGTSCQCESLLQPRQERGMNGCKQQGPPPEGCSALRLNQSIKASLAAQRRRAQRSQNAPRSPAAQTSNPTGHCNSGG